MVAAPYLLDESDVLAEPVQVQLVNRTPVQLDGPRLGVVPPLNQSDDRALPRARLSLEILAEGYDIGLQITYH